MVKATYPITNFTGGALSPRLKARIDIQKYRNGAAVIENGIVMPHGGIKKRPGTKHVFEVKDSTQSQELAAFEFNTEQAYILEFGPQYIRFFKDGGVIVSGSPATITGITAANPGVVTTSAAHGFSDGDQVFVSGVVGMTEVNNRRVTVANATSTTFEVSGVDTSGYTAYSSGGEADSPVEVTTTYAASEISDLSFAQSNDKLYIAHGKHPIRELTRTSHTAWTLTDTEIENGPFLALNTTDDTIRVDVDTSLASNMTGATKERPVVVTCSGGHSLEDGATVNITGVGGMTQVTGRYIARNVTSTTFELFDDDTDQPINGTGYGAYTSGGTVTPHDSRWGTYSPGTPVLLKASGNPFTSDDVGTLFRLYAPGKDPSPAVAVGGTQVYANSIISNDNKVYGLGSKIGSFTNWQNDFKQPVHSEGTVLTREMGGSKGFYITYLYENYAIVRVTGYTNTNQVSAIVVGRNHVPKDICIDGDSDATTIWQRGSWNEEKGYPAAITFHEKRLWAASTETEPQTVWGSKTGEFTNFEDGAEDDDAITINLASGQVEQVQWLVSGQVLFAGTASSIRAIKPSGNNSGLTPSNLDANTRIRYGTAPAKPVGIGDSLIFAQRRGLVSSAAKKLREVVYSFESDSYPAADLTIISEHITGATGITDLDYQPDPDSVAWAERADGKMAGMTYEREQEVAAWHSHTLGGTDAAVKSMAVIPGTIGDDVWLIVSRTINGGTVKHIEYITPGLLDDTAREDAIYLDSAATYDGAETSTVTGLWHLIGETVDCLVDGAKQTAKTVSATGTVSLDPAGSVVQVGKSYTSVVETLDLEAPARAGTAKSRVKRTGKIFLELYNTLGGTLGRDTSNQAAIEYRTPAELMDSAPALFTGLKEFDDFDDDGERAAVLRFEHDEPYPFHLLGIYAEINTAG